MSRRGKEVLGWIVAVLILIAILVGIAAMRYEFCMDAGYTHEQCLYEVGFNN